MGSSKFQLQENEIKASSAETGNATGSIILDSKTARALEIWALVTAVSGISPVLVLIIETSIDGTTFKEQTRISSITAVGAFSVPLNRADHALGKKIRVKWEITGTDTPTFTFSAVMGRMEG